MRRENITHTSFMPLCLQCRGLTFFLCRCCANQQTAEGLDLNSSVLQLVAVSGCCKCVGACVGSQLAVPVLFRSSRGHAELTQACNQTCSRHLQYHSRSCSHSKEGQGPALLSLSMCFALHNCTVVATAVGAEGSQEQLQILDVVVQQD